MNYPNLRIPLSAESGDPLKDDNRLLHGWNHPNNCQDQPRDKLPKSASSGEMSQLRWGTRKQITGKSKTGLVITVPDWDPSGTDAAPLTALLSGPVFKDRAILYTYASSSSSSGDMRSSNSFGAVGDHLSPHQLPQVSERAHRASWNTTQSESLRRLVKGSDVDRETYTIIAVGETGPAARPFASTKRISSDMTLIPQRRRSESDLIERQLKIAMPRRDDNTQDGITRETLQEARPADNTSEHEQTTVKVSEAEPDRWCRSGPTLQSLMQQSMTGRFPFSDNGPFDPHELEFPSSSVIYMMKAPDISWLTWSVRCNSWSNKHGANLVLQAAWEKKAPNSRILLLFSLIYPAAPEHRNTFCGLAEMIGPYQPTARTALYDWETQPKGLIPIRWVVIKDVPFSAFDDIFHNQQSVTQLRHANTIPKESGRRTLQRYIEAPHGSMALIHPQFGVPYQHPRAFHRPPEASVSYRGHLQAAKWPSWTPPRPAQNVLDRSSQAHQTHPYGPPIRGTLNPNYGLPSLCRRFAPAPQAHQVYRRPQQFPLPTPAVPTPFEGVGTRGRTQQGIGLSGRGAANNLDRGREYRGWQGFNSRR